MPILEEPNEIVEMSSVGRRLSPWMRVRDVVTSFRRASTSQQPVIELSNPAPYGTQAESHRKDDRHTGLGRIQPVPPPIPPLSTRLRGALSCATSRVAPGTSADVV